MSHLLGATTRVRHREEPTQIYENYWSADASGNLDIHGAYNYDRFEFTLRVCSAGLIEVPSGKFLAYGIG